MYNLLQMSFLQQFYEDYNPEMHLRMNDVLFLMVTSFFIGRWYQQRKYYQPQHKFTNETSKKDEAHQKHSQIKMLELPEPCETNNKENILDESQDSHFGSKNKEQYEKFENKENQILLEKIKLEGNKIQERGIFEMFFERKPNNLNFVRKIQRHEIISDYILKETTNNRANNQLIPINKESIIPNENSMLQLSYFQNYQRNSIKSQSPKFQKRIINLTEPSNVFSRLYFENGRFKKLFRNQLKIGQGAFGTVFEATNSMQGRKYAIKKVSMKILKNKMNNQFEKFFGEIRVLSRISHPNIVHYHTCWLEYAGLEEDNLRLHDYQLNHTQNKSPKMSFKMQNSRKSFFYSGKSEKYISQDDDQNQIFFQSNSGHKVDTHIIKQKKSKQIALNSEIGTIKNEMGLVPVIYIQMQLCQRNLLTYLHQRQHIDRKFIFSLMQRLLSGVNFLHNQRIVHRDLKPQNIFLTNDQQLVKIGDFGLSMFLGGEKQQKYLKVGTPAYIAPQLYTKDPQQLSQINPYLLDVYSLGVIYFELLSKFTTAHERSEKLLKLREGRVTGLNQFKLEKKIIKSMVQVTKRQSISQILVSENYLQLQKVINQQNNEA